MEGNTLLKEHTKTINNKIKLHILGVPMNKLGNWLIQHRTVLIIFARLSEGHHSSDDV